MAEKKEKRVAGVLFLAVREEVLNEDLKKRKLSTLGTVEERVRRMVDYQRRETPKGQLADCSTCGGDSDVNADRCPYCGDGELVDERPSQVRQVARSVESEPKKEESARVVNLNERRAVSELDVNVGTIRKLKLDLVGNIWELGDAIRDNYDRRLWTKRLKEDGSPKWKNWNQFCPEELGFSASYAYELIALSKTFTRDAVQKFGTEKLRVALHLPEPHRTQLLQASAGASVRALKGEVKKLKASGSVPARAGATPSKDKITVALTEARGTIPMMARKKVGTGWRPAMSLSDDPWCEIRLSNDVVARFVISKNTKAELQLLYEFRRETEKDD